MPGTPVTVVSLNGWTPHILYACAGALLQDLEFGTFLKKAPQRPNLGLWDLIGTFLGLFLYPFGTVTPEGQKFRTCMQNWDFFGTKFGLWSHLGPSPKFGTSVERLPNGRE